MAAFHTTLNQQTCWKSALTLLFFSWGLSSSPPWGILTHFHELADTRRTAIRAATADLAEYKRSELALREAKKKVLKLLPRSIFNFLIFLSCTIFLSYVSTALVFTLIKVDLIWLLLLLFWYGACKWQDNFTQQLCVILSANVQTFMCLCL